MTNTTPEAKKVSNDPVNHPKHYTEHPSGIECIQITEHMGFNLGNATKYIWRCDLKKDAIEDLKKARWYVDREIAKREQEKEASNTTGGSIQVDGSIDPTRVTNLVINPARLDESVIGKIAAEALKFEVSR